MSKDYTNTYPNAYIWYYANYMVLHIDSNAAYLVVPMTRRRIIGYYHLSNNPKFCQTPVRNGPVLVQYKIPYQIFS